jgi:hypothetical protein
VSIVKQIEQRRIQKAFLRYHDEKNWPLLRQALKDMGREDMIGDAPHQLVPAEKRIARGRPVAKSAATSRPAKPRPRR